MFLPWFAHVDSWSWSVSALSDGKVYSNFTPVDFYAITAILSHLCISIILKIDESEAPGAASLGVVYDLNILNWTILA